MQIYREDGGSMQIWDVEYEILWLQVLHKERNIVTSNLEYYHHVIFENKIVFLFIQTMYACYDDHPIPHNLYFATSASIPPFFCIGRKQNIIWIFSFFVMPVYNWNFRISWWKRKKEEVMTK